MRSCLLCKSTYPDEVNVCPVDGSTLDTRGRLDDTASIAPPEGSILPFAPFDPAFDGNGERTDATLPPVEPDAQDERTRQDRPAHRRLPPRKSEARMPAAGSGVSQTSELERDDFSMLLSADPGGPELVPPESRIGKVVGSYRLLEIIGRGGMGCVYRAEHVKLGRDVALKLLREDYAQRRDAVTRFFQEARAVNLIRHRNIVDVIDYVELGDGNVFIIMELLAGQSMGGLMRGTIELGRAIGILAQICEGLSAAHAVGIVHRDLKPDNIIIIRSPDGGDLVKILDFGVAKLGDKVASDPDLTAVGAVIGTPAYMSPEQAGGLAVDPRADVYALGAIMYELFTQHLVFRAGTFGEFVRRHLNEAPRPPRELPGCEDIDPELEAIILRCLEKGPDARFQNALALRASLLALLAKIEARARAEKPRDPSPARGWAAVPAVEAQVAARPGAARPAAMPPPIPAAARSAHLPVATVPPVPAAPVAPAQAALVPPPPPDTDDDDPDDSDLDEATIEVPREAALRRSPNRPAVPDPLQVGNAQPAARDTGPRDNGPRDNGPHDTGSPRTSGRVPQQAAAEPLAFGTPSPYSGLAQDLLRRSAAVPALPPSALSGPMAAQTTAASREVFDSQSVLPAPHRGRLLFIVALLVALVTGGIVFAIPFVTGDRGEQAVAAQPADLSAASPRAASEPPPAAAPVASPVATPPRPQPPAPATGDTVDTGNTVDTVDTGEHAHGGGERAETGHTAAARPATPVRVRIVSRPVGELFAAGRRGALCETPCALTINPGDGGSDLHRVYVVKRPGYKDRTVSIDLSDPPRQMRVDLEKLRASSRGAHGHRSGKDDDREDRSDSAANDDDSDGAAPATDDAESSSDAEESGEDTGNDKARAKGKDKGKGAAGDETDDSTFNPFSDPNRSGD